LVEDPNHSDRSCARLLGVWNVSGDASDEELHALAKVIAERMLAGAQRDESSTELRE
jgi:hypothetical protein